MNIFISIKDASKGGGLFLVAKKKKMLINDDKFRFVLLIDSPLVFVSKSSGFYSIYFASTII